MATNQARLLDMLGQSAQNARKTLDPDEQG